VSTKDTAANGLLVEVNNLSVMISGEACRSSELGDGAPAKVLEASTGTPLSGWSFGLSGAKATAGG
jgi:hypothetical protein